MTALALSLVAAGVGRQNMGRTTGLGTHHAACLGVTGAALLREVAYQCQHERDVCAITQEATLLLHRQQASVQHGLEVKLQCVGGDIETAGKLPGHPSLQARFHQQTPDIEPNAGGEGFKHLGGHRFVHVIHLEFSSITHYFSKIRTINMRETSSSPLPGTSTDRCTTRPNHLATSAL